MSGIVRHLEGAHTILLLDGDRAHFAGRPDFLTSILSRITVFSLTSLQAPPLMSLFKTCSSPTITALHTHTHLPIIAFSLGNKQSTDLSVCWSRSAFESALPVVIYRQSTLESNLKGTPEGKKISESTLGIVLGDFPLLAGQQWLQQGIFEANFSCALWPAHSNLSGHFPHQVRRFNRPYTIS